MSTPLVGTLPPPNALQKKVQALGKKLKRRQITGSQNVALEVVRLLRDLVAANKLANFELLLAYIELIGKELQTDGPKELVITNITRRVLKFLTEEYQTALQTYLLTSSSSSISSTPNINSYPTTPWGAGGLETPGTFFPERGDPFNGFNSVGAGGGRIGGSLFELLGHRESSTGVGNSSISTGKHESIPNSSWTPTSPISTPSSPHKIASPNPNSDRPAFSRSGTTTSTLSPHVQTMLTEDFSKKSLNLKPIFIEAIQELIDEIEMTHRSVGEWSLDHIHSGEFILTIGSSKTVEAFLKNAARKRKFTVIVAETAPSFSGRITALSLSSAGIPTILIPDSNIFSLLPKCSKVLLGPHIILADGAIHSIAGSLPLCLAANRMRVPVVVCCGMFKFSPLFKVGGDDEWGLRDLGSPGEVLETGTAEGETEVLNPRWDVVPAELVDLYITNMGGHPSSLLYRLLSDMYGST